MTETGHKKQSVRIGDKVAWRIKRSLIGTIKDIVLGDFSFYVVWDDGSDDWYKGSDLVLVSSEDSQ